jgi:hypothetical protein
VLTPIGFVAFVGAGLWIAVVRVMLALHARRATAEERFKVSARAFSTRAHRGSSSLRATRKHLDRRHETFAKDCHEGGPPLVTRSGMVTNREAPRRPASHVARWIGSQSPQA